MAMQGSINFVVAGILPAVSDGFQPLGWDGFHSVPRMENEIRDAVERVRTVTFIVPMPLLFVALFCLCRLLQSKLAFSNRLLVLAFSTEWRLMVSG